MTKEELEITRASNPIENVDFGDKKFKLILENPLNPMREKMMFHY